MNVLQIGRKKEGEVPQAKLAPYGGATIIATGLAEGVAITMRADPALSGRYTGSFQTTEEGVPVTV